MKSNRPSRVSLVHTSRPTLVLAAASTLAVLSACSGGYVLGDADRADAEVVASEEPPPVVSERETCSDNPRLAGCSGVDQNISGDPITAGSASAAPADAPVISGDNFEAPGTNPFVMADHDPLSTFGVDVDTASYDVFQRDVEDGLLPAPASVRLEEYVNFFAYDYPLAEATAEVPFTISLAAAPSPLDAGLTLLRVGIQGKAPPPAGEKRPANLVFLVDTSGSMDEADKLPLAQQVLRQALDLLEPTDTVSIVSYAGDTTLRLAPTPVSERDRIVAQISRSSRAAAPTARAASIWRTRRRRRHTFRMASITSSCAPTATSTSASATPRRWSI
jgi:Ca-activated chloride channel family protein